MIRRKEKTYGKTLRLVELCGRVETYFYVYNLGTPYALTQISGTQGTLVTKHERRPLTSIRSTHDNNSQVQTNCESFYSYKTAASIPFNSKKLITKNAC